MGRDNKTARCAKTDMGWGFEEKKLTDLLSSGWSLNSLKRWEISSCGCQKESFIGWCLINGEEALLGWLMGGSVFMEAL